MSCGCHHAPQPVGSRPNIKGSLSRMALVYGSLALLQVVFMFASLAGLGYVIVRAIYRFFFVAKEPPPKKEDLRHLKRAGQ